ncbi:BppU family phage baseplate upper protein [Enterococcus faecium]|uniref:BppU family phage baseplate upper protein n=1 Tax=Enterococcus faecium TaxID=1352 RepID=UPI001C8C14BD|nr:BppU family phage baseplate upper protein [Enterococcus faecium]MBX8922528.1 BppU family phage baseplate upper protein [Enterococcus faecium]MBX8950621.1 BppU family phage baseplate upper protein [Escherichia coli]
MANLEIKLSANKRQPYLRHRVVGRVGEGGLTTINVQLLEEDEITPFVINLNGTLKFVGEVSNGNYTEGEPEIIDSTNGLISYTFTKSNFSTSHQFKQAYFEYVDPNGKKVTFQNFIIDVLERVDINVEQAKYYISSLEKLQSEMQTTFNQFISDKQIQYDQIYSKYNELVRLLNESDKQANDRIDQTNQQIGDLGKLKKMYSNSIDFGGYDYSGRANLMPSLDFSKLSGANYTIQTPPSYIKDGGTYFVLDASDTSAANTTRNVFIPFLGRLEKGATYVVTIPMMISEDFGTNYSDSPIYPYNVNDGTTTTHPLTMTPNADCRGKWQFVEKAFTVPSDMTDGKFAPFLHVYQNKNQTGKLYIGYDIKIEKVNSTSDTATPYQPNLLDAPYYLSKVALGENLIKPESQQPVTNSNYLINTYNIKPMVKGKKYTITLEGTKPATQVFRPFFTRATGDAWEVGDLQPVEGLTNVWSKTFTAADDSHPTTPQVQIYQVPSTSVGQCTIKWLKLEEGNTRTPNISQFKYFGEGLKDSNNPNDYSWDVTPEYTEKGLNNTVSLTEPQSIEGLKNFEDGIQSKGKSVLTSDDNKYEVVTLTVTNGNTGSAKLYREGKTVTIYFVALNGKSSAGNDSTILTISEGYRPPISFEQLVGSIDRSTLNSAQLSIGADGAIKWRRNSSYGSDYTFAITYTI